MDLAQQSVCGAAWIGLKVRSIRPFRSAAVELPAGSEYCVEYAGRTGLDLVSSRCSKCGTKQYLSGVSVRDVEVIDAPRSIQLGLEGLSPPVSPPLRDVVASHCDDLERAADILERHQRSSTASMRTTIDEIRLAVRELRTALASDADVRHAG